MSDKIIKWKSRFGIGSFKICFDPLFLIFLEAVDIRPLPLLKEGGGGEYKKANLCASVLSVFDCVMRGGNPDMGQNYPPDLHLHPKMQSFI